MVQVCVNLGKRVKTAALWHQAPNFTHGRRGLLCGDELSCPESSKVLVQPQAWTFTVTLPVVISH